MDARNNLGQEAESDQLKLELTKLKVAAVDRENGWSGQVR